MRKKKKDAVSDYAKIRQGYVRGKTYVSMTQLVNCTSSLTVQVSFYSLENHHFLENE